MSQNTPKILIISSDTGGGHRSAAQALADGLEKFWTRRIAVVRVIKAVEESHHITDKLVNVYNWMLRNKQHWMKYLYWAVNSSAPRRASFFIADASVMSRDSLKNGARISSSASIL